MSEMEAGSRIRILKDISDASHYGKPGEVLAHEGQLGVVTFHPGVGANWALVMPEGSNTQVGVYISEIELLRPEEAQ